MPGIFPDSPLLIPPPPRVPPATILLGGRAAPLAAELDGRRLPSAGCIGVPGECEWCTGPAPEAIVVTFTGVSITAGCCDVPPAMPMTFAIDRDPNRSYFLTRDPGSRCSWRALNVTTLRVTYWEWDSHCNGWSYSDAQPVHLFVFYDFWNDRLHRVVYMVSSGIHFIGRSIFHSEALFPFKPACFPFQAWNESKCCHRQEGVPSHAGCNGFAIAEA